jgi:trimeric autotransporter adhesin
VIGIDDSPDGAYGVQGISRVGVGVYGVGSSGAPGVMGESTIYIGVVGTSPTGTGVAGSSPLGTGVSAASTKGIALSVQGIAAFSNSGVATVRKDSQTVTVKLAGVTTSSIVLATIQKPGSGIAVEGAAPASGSFRISLTAKAPADIPVGWFVIG